MRTEHDSEEKQFQRASQGLLGGLFVLLKVAMLHDMDNRAVNPVVNRFRVSLSQLLATGNDRAALQFVGDGVYCNQRLIRADLETWEKARFIRDFFARLGVGEVVFTGEVPEASIRQFISAVRQVSLEPDRADEVRGQTFDQIAFRELKAEGANRRDRQLSLPDPIRVLRAFGVIVVTLRELLVQIERGESLALLHLRRAVQEFVRLPAHTASLQLGVLALEQYRGDLAGRLARVGITVVMMGKRLGLGVADLRELGVSAALAGVGRVFSPEMASAPLKECLRSDDLIRGARYLMTFSGRGRASSLRLIASAELKSEHAWRQGHPLTRMIAVAEAYEDLTTREPNGPGLPPYEALRQISDDPDYDTPAALALIATLGLFPVGSMVKLSNGETAMVIKGPQESDDPARPQVMVISDARDGMGHGRVLDLASSQLAVTGTVDAVDLEVNVGQMLFA